jgi:hypothetical protein
LAADELYTTTARTCGKFEQVLLCRCTGIQVGILTPLSSNIDYDGLPFLTWDKRNGTALTTLIGSAAAESLILGNHGAAGVAWATMSAFGLLWVVRACIAAVCPGWLRETIGVRTSDSDLALGMELASRSNSRGAAIIRKKYVLNGLLGIVVDQSEALQQVN